VPARCLPGNRCVGTYPLSELQALSGGVEVHANERSLLSQSATSIAVNQRH
jgi:hypothetical protein